LEKELASKYWGLYFSDISDHFPYHEETKALFRNVAMSNRYDNGCIFFGFEAKKLVECLGYEGIPVDLDNHSEQFGGTQNLFGGIPNKEDAQKRTKDILRKLHESDPFHVYTVTFVELNFKSQGDEWSYGKIEISQVALPTWTKITCRPHDHQFLYSSNILTTSTFDVGSPFADMMVSLFFSMSIKNKLVVIIQATSDALPATQWTIAFKNEQKLEIKDLFCLGLYADLKADVITKDTNFSTLENLLIVIRSNMDMFCVPPIAATAIYAVKKLSDDLGILGKSVKFEEYSSKLDELFSVESFKPAQEEAKRTLNRHQSKDLKESLNEILNANIKNHIFARSH